MIYLFLADGFEEMEAITIVDILRRASLEIQTVSITDNLAVKSSHNVVIQADKTFNQIDTGNIQAAILPGGMPGATNLYNHSGLKQFILKLNDSKTLLAAICAAPFVLGQFGILRGKNAICYPGFESKLIEANITNQNVVADGNVITSKGPGTAIEFALKIVETLKDKKQVETLKSDMILYYL